MNLFKRIFCIHEDMAHGFSYVKCKNCKRVKYSPKLAGELIEDRCAKMVGMGADRDSLNKRLTSHGLNPISSK